MRSMQHPFYAGSGDNDRVFGQRWAPNGSQGDHGVSWDLAARLVDRGWPRCADREARIPLGVEVHLEKWGDTVLLVDFDSGEHGDGGGL